MTCVGHYEVKSLVYEKFIENKTNVYVLTHARNWICGTLIFLIHVRSS
jgi:hypothetical protein